MHHVHAWHWSYKWLWATMWELGIETVPSGKGASATNHWGIAPAPVIIIVVILLPSKYPGANKVVSMKKNLMFFQCVDFSFYSTTFLICSWSGGSPNGMLDTAQCVHLHQFLQSSRRSWLFLFTPLFAVRSYWYSVCGPTDSWEEITHADGPGVSLGHLAVQLI